MLRGVRVLIKFLLRAVIVRVMIMSVMCICVSLIELNVFVVLDVVLTIVLLFPCLVSDVGVLLIGSVYCCVRLCSSCRVVCVPWLCLSFVWGLRVCCDWCCCVNVCVWSDGILVFASMCFFFL